jgi:hypothetical protein
MFRITTFIFALGIIALVLETTVNFQLLTQVFDFGCYLAWATITCLMVGLGDVFMPPY